MNNEMQTMTPALLSKAQLRVSLKEPKVTVSLRPQGHLINPGAPGVSLSGNAAILWSDHG